MPPYTRAFSLEQALPRNVLRDCGKDQLQTSPVKFANWLFSHEASGIPSVYRYLAYLKTMHELAYAIAEIYDWRSPPDSHGKKEHLRHIGPVEILSLANHLYVLDSFDVSGNVLECGASHGYSTCVLSHACAQLKRRLFVADSFEGLPPTRKDQDFFAQGDYAASIESVSDNLAALGRLDAVDFIKGFYANSLKGFRHPLCLLWLDVDLYESAQDVLSNVFSCLNPAGMIATHEFTDFHNRPHSIDEKYPPRAIFNVFKNSGLNYRAIHLMRYFGMIAGDNAVQPDSGMFFPFLLHKLDTMDHRSRRFRELKQSNTVRTAFRIKNLLRPHQTKPSAPAESSAADAMSAAELEIQKDDN